MFYWGISMFTFAYHDTFSVNRYGEIVNINLVRDKKTGKTKGFCFLCYEDQRSTILAVDNLNGIKVSIHFPETLALVTILTSFIVLHFDLNVI